MQVTPTQPTNNVTQYMQLQPLAASMKTNNDQLPKNSLPVDNFGTIQQVAEATAKPKLSIYNAHGVVTPQQPNSIVAYA